MNGKRVVGKEGVKCDGEPGAVAKLTLDPATRRVTDQKGGAGVVPAQQLDTLRALCADAGVENNIDGWREACMEATLSAMPELAQGEQERGSRHVRPAIFVAEEKRLLPSSTTSKTKSEFEDIFGGTAQWDTAQPGSTDVDICARKKKRKWQEQPPVDPSQVISSLPTGTTATALSAPRDGFIEVYCQGAVGAVRLSEVVLEAPLDAEKARQGAKKRQVLFILRSLIHAKRFVSPIFKVKKPKIVLPSVVPETLSEACEPLKETLKDDWGGGIQDLVKRAMSVVGSRLKHLKGLTQDEAASVCLYTLGSDFYTMLNDALWKPDNDDVKPFLPYLALLRKALGKMKADAKTICFRGASSDHVQYEEGETIVWWGVTSITHCEDVARGFAEDVLIKCEVSRAIPVSHLSEFPGEEELLVFPGTQLVVEKVEKPKEGDEEKAKKGDEDEEKASADSSSESSFDAWCFFPPAKLTRYDMKQCFMAEELVAPGSTDAPPSAAADPPAAAAEGGGKE